MAKVAFSFPGQGSQSVGMGKDLRKAYPAQTSPLFEQANDTLQFDLAALCFGGPEEDLVRTENQQPAIFLVSMATHAVLQSEGMRPAAVAGHSLGEYSALAAAGAISFADGLRLARQRGLLMAEVADRTGGIMAAILGLDAAQVEEACSSASTHGVVEVANYNAPSQTVISGEPIAMERAIALVQEQGARRVVRLAVSAPFHCSLMAPVADEFQACLEDVSVQEADPPVVANVTATYESAPEEIRDNLVRQLASPVRWSESVHTLTSDGFDTFVEVGPGRVLTGLMRSIDRAIATYHTSDADSLTQTLERLHQP